MMMALKLKFLSFLDQSQNSVPASKRGMAYLIDWFLGALCMMFPLCLGWMMLTQDQENMGSVNVFRLNEASGMGAAVLLGLAGLAFAFFYYIWVPYKVYPGQTVGKRTMGLKIEKVDGSKLTFKDILLRQGVGLLILEGVLFNPSRLWQDMVSLLTGLNFTGYLLYASLAITIISFLLMVSGASRRMLHDYISKTRVNETRFERADQSI